MAKDVDIKPGDVLGGKYRVERVIGQGGMGVVLAARHTALHHRVAVKVMIADQAKDAELVARFEREARAAAHLKSEHAVRVMDFGRRSSGVPFMVMELLDGETLGAICARRPLSVAEAVDFTVQACEAVAEAHALGIVHRDLKPANLFLAKRPAGLAIVKVLDFGLAKHLSMADRALTTTTTVMGSPQYMSPEQMRASRDVDLRTDIWSLGVCLYELLSSRVPFESEAIPELCAMVLKDPPTPIARYRPDLPPRLADVLERCLAKDRAHRFASVGELVAALDPFASPARRGAPVRIAAVVEAARSAETIPQAPMGEPGGMASTASTVPRTAVRPTWVVPVSVTLALVGLGLGAASFSAGRARSSSRAPAVVVAEHRALALGSAETVAAEASSGVEVRPPPPSPPTTPAVRPARSTPKPATSAEASKHF